MKVIAANALAEVERLKRDLEASKKLIDTQAQTIEAANAALAANASERAAAERTIEAADKAIQTQGRAMEAQEHALNSAMALIDKYDTRLSNVEAQRDAATKRGFWGTVGGIVGGVLIGRRF